MTSTLYHFRENKRSVFAKAKCFLKKRESYQETRKESILPRQLLALLPRNDRRNGVSFPRRRESIRFLLLQISKIIFYAL
jgi:hypothetical protein